MRIPAKTQAGSCRAHTAHRHDFSAVAVFSAGLDFVRFSKASLRRREVQGALTA